jgi:hypothetical protein
MDVLLSRTPSRKLCRDKTLMNECFMWHENAFPEEKKQAGREERLESFLLTTPEETKNGA